MAAFDSRQENTHAIELPHSIDTPQGACLRMRASVSVCVDQQKQKMPTVLGYSAQTAISNRCNAFYPVSDDDSNMWMILY